jgi:hypothetical protein
MSRDEGPQVLLRWIDLVCPDYRHEHTWRRFLLATFSSPGLQSLRDGLGSQEPMSPKAWTDPFGRFGGRKFRRWCRTCRDETFGFVDNRYSLKKDFGASCYYCGAQEEGLSARRPCPEVVRTLTALVEEAWPRRQRLIWRQAGKSVKKMKARSRAVSVLLNATDRESATRKAKKTLAQWSKEDGREANKATLAL